MAYLPPTVLPMGDPDGDEPDSVFTHTERTFHAAVAAASRGLATSRGEADASARKRLLTAAAAEVAEAEELHGPEVGSPGHHGHPRRVVGAYC